VGSSNIKQVVFLSAMPVNIRLNAEVTAQRRSLIMKKPGTRSFFAAVIVFCSLPVLLPAQGGPLDAPQLTISSVDQVVVIDRLIADRAYLNIKAGLPPDQGIDFALLDKEMEKYRPELEKLDPAYYAVLRETYERMKAYVTNPNSDFVRAVQKPGSVEFEGRSPLPAAAFADTAGKAQNAKAPAQGLDELEPFLSSKAKKTLSKIRKMPGKTTSERKVKFTTIEKKIAVWKTNHDQLEAAVMLRILRGMHEQFQPDSALPHHAADTLPQGITQEMLDARYNARGAGPEGK
jgi:hypothetical protein